MLIMESRMKIVNLYRQGHKIKSISRMLRLSRNTVRKIIRSLEEAVKTTYTRKKQTSLRLDGYTEYLEKLLRDNKLTRPRLTGRAIYEKLTHKGYRGSYSAVMRYSKEWKAKTNQAIKKACVPLSFSKGEAYQFDWSSEAVMLGGEIKNVKVAQFTLCYSRKKFLYIYPSETQEMLFDAHARAFEFFGGTPIKGIYDNMKTAVTKILKGKDRKWNVNFMRLCVHYRIEPVACNPASGNEKGRVERQIQTLRQEFFSPIPQADTLEELNEALTSQVINYNKHHKHPKFKTKTIDEVFIEERSYLVSAPILFDSCKEVFLKASLTCLVRYESNDYSVHCSLASQTVKCKIYANQIVFVFDGKEVGRHKRSFAKGEAIYDWLHYVPMLSIKPGALRNGAPFLNMELPLPLKQVREHLKQKGENGSRDFALILSYISTESLDAVTDACKQAIENHAVSKDVIINILMRRKDEADPPEVGGNSSLQYPKLKHQPIADCNIYNQLLSKSFKRSKT